MKLQIYFIPIVFLTLGMHLTAISQISALDILDKSIAYHDPDQKLAQGQWELLITETRPDGSDRLSAVSLSPEHEYYKIQRSVDGDKTLMILDKNKSSFSLNGKSNFTPEEKEKFRLDEDRLKVMKDYYRYLWHLPMTLRDPGTIIDDTVKRKEFDDQDTYEVKVTYDPDVGGDIWYFYFDPTDYHLIGYRFYHDESVNDGEYITLSGETRSNNVRLPSIRKWYMHKEDKYLGSDQLTVLRQTKD